MSQLQSNPVETERQGQPLVDAVTTFVGLREHQRDLEKEARQFAKQADAIEKELREAVTAAGGMLEVGSYVLGFEDVSGRPSWKGICERHIAAAVILRELQNVKPTQKLTIV